MSELQLTAEDLLAGTAVVYDVVVPPSILRPGQAEENTPNQEMIIQLRPLKIGTFQLIMKATKNDPSLIPLLMIKESLVQPALTLEQVKQLHLGLINFLIAHIREISGLTQKKKLTN